ncbi:MULTISPECIES: glycoside hydrolase family 5 protein [unclassified Butyrivibrio]|uniref:glycoside hydrolase family 5 protein n=1 Tax=unclassified Butyrivibrio TaxID=2639466 RepID=UPI0003B37F9C|nr:MULTISPECIES: cellulase family glycosylhydrolase [unclassified Butyrivibrio]SDB61472.1 Cellulase (glycosyl hydrolase family 5) [Butyrivibrio sp. INlla16]SEM46440.1 Cellulase (glycosyl hydrolase family 5) [Butyrivibrio sp. ob235]
MKQFPGFSHGINLGGWLSQCDHTKERYDNFITESDIEKIKSWGLDHIRIPVDYDLVEEKDGTYKEEGFAYIQKALDWTGKYGLNTVLDLHKTYGYSFDSGEQEAGFFENEKFQERFYKLWEQFAQRFGKYEDRLAFELLNEVTKPEYGETWNRISTECIKRIRVYAPTIKILLGGYYNNSIVALKDICDPYDENVVYNFHCYEPLIFTHQGAPWIETMDPNFRMAFDSTYRQYDENAFAQLGNRPEEIKVDDPDKKLGIEYFEQYMQEAVRVAEERNVALYCGEYGVIERATPEDALKWYTAIGTCFNKYNIGRAAWSYKEMDFGLSDARMDGVRDEVLKMM